MLREETESERVDYRVARADSRAISNRCKGVHYLHLDRKYSDNDNRVQRRRGLSAETTEDEAEDEENRSEEENAEVQKVDVNGEKEEKNENEREEDGQIGECAICRVTIDDANLGGSIVNSEQELRRSEGYLLCQCCVRKFSIRSGAEHLQPRKSHASFSEGKDNDDRGRARTRRTYDAPVATYLQPPPARTSGTCREDQWARGNFGRTICCPVGEQANETTDYDAEISDAVSYVVVDRDRDRDPRDAETRTERECSGRQCQHHSQHRNLTTRWSDAADRSSAEMKVKSLASSADCSRRPIRCPRLDCSVNVAFSALTHHFLFDHPEVPILSVEPGVESTLIVSYDALACNSSRCLALLLVSGKLSDSAARLFGGNQINPKYRNRLPLPVLAARLHSNRYACCEEVHAGGEGQCEKDVIIAWVAGLDVGDTTDRLRCSIQAVDSIENGGFRSLTYTGPVTSLRTAQCPRDVFLAGDCIVLHEGLIGHITSGCTSLNVNVIVY